MEILQRAKFLEKTHAVIAGIEDRAEARKMLSDLRMAAEGYWARIDDERAERAETILRERIPEAP